MADYHLKFKSFRSLEKVWKDMESPNMSPFLHYDYMRFIKTAVTWTKPFFTRIVCILSKHDNDILMICPMKLRIDFKYYTLLGDMQGCDVADVLWKQDLSGEDKEAIIRFFFETMKQKMYLNRIPEQSYFAKGVPSERLSFSREVPYVAIDLSSDYASFFQRLSSSVRQNIRTAYNRLKRDNVAFEFQCYSGQRRMPERLWKQIQSVYAKRLCTQYSDNASYLHGLKTRIAVSWKHDSRSLRHNDNSYLAVLKTGDKVMAFLAGFKTHAGDRIVVPRLAIDATYRFYSPGYVLLSETIKHLQQQGIVTTLDLSRGDERYKTDFGGQLYYIKDFVVEKE